MESKQIILQNILVTYLVSESFKKERCLLFLHGWQQTGKSFEKVLKLLEKNGVSFLALDLPGFGGTGIKNYNMHVEDYGQFVVGFIERMELVKPTLVGHSFGGRITIYIASFYENIEKIVLIGSAGIKQKTNYLRLIFVKVGKYLFTLPFLKKYSSRLRDKYSSRDSISSGNMRKIFLNTIGNDLQKYMKIIRIPSLLIRGNEDCETPVSEGEIIHQTIQDSVFEIIPKGTHFVFQEFADDVVELFKKYKII